jgi:hypothetical protein
VSVLMCAARDQLVGQVVQHTDNEDPVIRRFRELWKVLDAAEGHAGVRTRVRLRLANVGGIGLDARVIDFAQASSDICRAAANIENASAWEGAFLVGDELVLATL